MKDILVTITIEFILDESEIKIIDIVGSGTLANKISNSLPNYVVTFGRALGKAKRDKMAYDKIYVEKVNPNPISVQSVVEEINKIFEALINNQPQNPGIGTGAAVHGDRQDGVGKE